MWVLFAHAHDTNQVSPLLALSSPEKRCGKTTLLSLLTSLVPRAVPASNITTAALFRFVSESRPTLLIDEADTFLQDNEELRGVLNSGHLRNMAFVVRVVGDDHKPTLFATWCPKAIAMIGRLPDTLADRSLAVRMQRKPPGLAVERLRMDTFDATDEYRQAARWAADNFAELVAVGDPSMPDGLNDRAADNWRPLLSIADVAGGRWPDVAREACVLLTRLADDDGVDVGSMLLEDMRGVFDEIGSEGTVSSVDAVAALNAMEHRPWPEVGRGRNPLSVRGLAARLAKYAITPKRLPRSGGKPIRGYFVEDFSEAWTRYVSPPGASSAGTPGTDGAKYPDLKDLARNSGVPLEQSVPDEPAQCRVENRSGTEVAHAKSLDLKDLEASVPLGHEIRVEVPRCAFTTCSRRAAAGLYCTLHAPELPLLF